MSSLTSNIPAENTPVENTPVENTPVENTPAVNQKKQENTPPEYNIVTEENQYEFIIWCVELKPPSIDVFKFNMILQLNLNKWIYENNVTWQYAYGNTIDTLKIQEEIEESNKQQSNKTAETKATTYNKEKKEELEKKEEPEKIKKPIDKVKRRELFAKMAEQRQKNRYKKIKR